jgi:WD40 repeat protein
MKGEKPTFDPFATVQITSTRDDAVSAVCLVESEIESERLLPDEDDSSFADDEWILPSRNLLARTTDPTNIHYLTGQRNGDTFLWKGHNRLHSLTPNRGGTCLSLQRAGPGRVLLQTKDEAGTVSFHDLETNQTISSFQTMSKTFCAAVSYENHLTVLPTSVETVVQLYDERQSSAKTMVFHAAGLSPKDGAENLRQYGMVSSLAVDANMIACGMESGHVFYHDIRMEPRVCSSVKLDSSDPIICLNMKENKENNSIVTVAGQAGDKDDQNTISWVESKRDPQQESMQSRVRTQLSTSRTGKTGVSCARLLSERLVAVGGWDGRLRIFNRSKLMALGRGHTGSIQSLDWHDSCVITGGVDGRVLLWDVSALSTINKA